MPRNHKPRKRYAPKRSLWNPLAAALDRVTLLDAEQRVLLDSPLLGALEAFRTGRGTREHWMSLVDAMNVAESIAQRGIFREDRADAYGAAQAVLADVSDRHAAGRGWTLRGPEITALTLGVRCHELQMDQVSQGEMSDAIESVKRRVQQALAGNASPGARICTAGLLGRAG